MSFLGIEEAHWKNVADLRRESIGVLISIAGTELREALQGVEKRIEYLRSEKSHTEVVLQRLAPVPWWDFASWIVRKAMRPYWQRRFSTISKCLKSWEDYAERLKVGVEAKEINDFQTTAEVLKEASHRINIWENGGVFVPNLYAGIQQMHMENRADEILRRIETKARVS